jgi:hypothetical protein
MSKPSKNYQRKLKFLENNRDLFELDFQSNSRVDTCSFALGLAVEATKRFQIEFLKTYYYYQLRIAY